METQKMTIHRALSELKLIDAKINKQINEIVPTGIYQKGKLINGHIKEDDFKADATSKYDSIVDLINRKIKIKSAIVVKNGITTVKVGEKEMTIADAINFKANIVLKKNLIASITQKHNHAIGLLNKNNEMVEKNCQTLLEHAVGKDSIKTGSEDVKAIQEPFMDKNQFHLCDPLDAKKKVEALEKEIIDFEAEIDAVLSEINATTFIEIS